MRVAAALRIVAHCCSLTPVIATCAYLLQLMLLHVAACVLVVVVVAAVVLQTCHGQFKTRNSPHFILFAQLLATVPSSRGAVVRACRAREVPCVEAWCTCCHGFL